MIPSWQLLEQVFTVETIMTPRDQLLEWTGNGSLEALWEEAERLKVDTIPVVQEGHITGFLKRGHSEVHPLTPSWLISRDTSIPHMLEIFANGKQSGLFVFHRQEVIGIVTPSDLNKLPARTYFYNLMAELEMLISGRTVTHFKEDEERILQILEHQYRNNEASLKRLSDVRAELKTMRETGNEINVVHTLNLADLVNVLCKEKELRTSLGFQSKSQVEDQLNGLVQFRNHIMHPVRLIWEKPGDLEKLNERIQRGLALVHRWNNS